MRIIDIRKAVEVMREQLDKIGGTEPTIVIAARLPQRTHHHNTKGTT